MSGLIPDPPVHDDRPDTLRVSPLDVERASAQGGYGRCVLCQAGGYRWVDLSVLGVAPVVDRSGTLTDQMPLHGACLRPLFVYWVSIVRGEPVGDEPEQVARVQDGGPGDDDRDGDSADRPLPTSDRLALLGGMYA